MKDLEQRVKELEDRVAKLEQVEEKIREYMTYKDMQQEPLELAANRKWRLAHGLRPRI